MGRVTGRRAARVVAAAVLALGLATHVQGQTNTMTAQEKANLQFVLDWWRDVLQARYRGKRYSFGYPACPDLAGQRALFAVLRPEGIGVQLTDGDMMDPEASVSALVFHHPEARYFGV